MSETVAASAVDPGQKDSVNDSVSFVADVSIHSIMFWGRCSVVVVQQLADTGPDGVAVGVSLVPAGLLLVPLSDGIGEDCFRSLSRCVATAAVDTDAAACDGGGDDVLAVVVVVMAVEKLLLLEKAVVLLVAATESLLPPTSFG